ncbi:unnamed protein product [Microthlaspi erraticum]|uniref:Neprosin activation peptide domain-containing protein n=1 Tax=Microthlaspi erraticum TaxID=1685480 RepID=A0A6D2I0Y7_9BRAS|nr:unnamed protein product [Microthlaspi erraticum]
MARLMIICLFLVLPAASVFSVSPSLVTSRKLLETKKHEMLFTERVRDPEEEKSHVTHVTKSHLKARKKGHFPVDRFLISAPSPGVGHSGGGR